MPAPVRTPGRRAAGLVVAALAAAAVTGCSGPGPSPDAGSTATRPATTVSSPPQAMESRDDLVMPTAIAWDSWRATSPTTIEVAFVAGPASCSGVQATVKETAADVTIDLAAGALPGSARCPAIALATTTSIELSQPLGDRNVGQSAE